MTDREQLREFESDYNKSEDDLKALQSVGQIIGEVLRQLDEERCMRFARFSIEDSRAYARAYTSDYA